MATEYHLTPEGPRRCSVDRSNPNSRGCPLGGTHFDSFDDAMEVYTEDLRNTFGDFHVLVRPSGVERIRRAGYRSLDGIEKVKANPQVEATVKTLKTLRAKAREAISEIKGHYSGVADPRRASTLPESVATEPLIQEEPEDREAEAVSEEVFSRGEPESMQDFSSRILARASETSFKMEPMDRSEIDGIIEAIEAREKARSTPAPKREKPIRNYRAAISKGVRTAKAQARALPQNAKRKLSDAGYTVRASASVAKDVAAIKLRSAGAMAQAGFGEVQQRAARMSIPAGHIRPGDTFDGTRVRAVEAIGGGKVKISYQAQAGGPVLATTVAGDRSMRVDRKTRRESRNARIASKVAKPIARSKALSQRLTTASSEQLSALGNIRRRDQRFGSVNRSIQQHERTLRQRELIGKLRELRTSSQDRVLQDS